ncbi:MATE family efflux transporter [Lachnospiraceae bacterium SGI.085]
MSNKTSDLTTGVLGKQILLLSLPLMFSNLLQVLFNISDIAVVGKFAGAYALGSVGSTSILLTLFLAVPLGMGGGINVLTALAIGSRSKKDVSETIHTAAIISLIAGILLLAFGMFFARDLLTLLNTKEELIEGAVAYLHVYFLGMPAVALYNFGNAVFSAAGNTRKPLVYLSIAGVVNVILNLFFVIVLKIDVCGVAAASAISQYLSAGLLLKDLFRGEGMCRLQMTEMKLTGSKAKRILQIGVPSAFQYMIYSVANLFVQTGVNTFSATVVAGNSAAANADNLVYDIMAAFYTVCGSFMGQNLGARKKDRVKKSYLICLFYSFMVGLVVGLLLVLFGHQFLSLFANDEAVIEAGMERLMVMGLAYCISAFMDCTTAATRALGKTVFPTIVMILGSCVFRIVWIYTVFAVYHTTRALYLLYGVSWVITAIPEIIYFVIIYRKNVSTIES